jgi:lysophospholipase L1-like esterase
MDSCLHILMPINSSIRNNLFLITASTFLSLIIISFLIEMFLGYQYESWKSDFSENSNKWFGGLTMISDNPVLMWEYRPNTQSQGRFKSILTNRYGFRDVDYESKQKPAGVTRVSFIGDSVTLGLKVGPRENFVSKFSASTAESYPELNIQALNHGIGGYNTVQIAELLKTRVLSFEPDTVIYLMCLNDFDFEESSGDKMRFFKKPDSFIVTELEKVYRSYRDIDFHDWHFARNRNAVFTSILEMQQLLTEQNIGFQVLILPIFDFSGADKGFVTYPLHGIHAEVGEFLRQNNIAYLDLLEPFQEQQEPPHNFAYDIWHPNPAGHDLIARQASAFWHQHTD